MSARSGFDTSRYPQKRLVAFYVKANESELDNLRGTGSLGGCCNVKLGKWITFTSHDYKGNALDRMNDRSETVFFDVHMKNGELHVFESVMHYIEWEKAWVTNVHLKPDFLDALAKGYKPSLRGSKSTEDADYPWVADFGLSGSAKVRRTMQDICGF